jgi:hypothetical protein
MPIVIWRDSVAMGDDVDAPHEWAMPATLDTTLAEVVGQLLDARYPASIIGGHATWFLEGDRPLAVLAQQWDAPRWLVAPGTTVTTVRRPSGPPDLQLRYCAQADPERVYACLRDGEPLPDRYGR